MNKSNILFITDSLGDVREADKAGISTVVVTWGIHDKGYFNPEINHNILAIVDSVIELRGVLVYN